MKSILLVKKFWGLVEMTSGLVNASFSLPEWQAVKMIFFAPWFLTLFTVKEMADGIVEPSRANSSGQATLDQERVDLLKSKYS